jgi:hypothetical protein
LNDKNLANMALHQLPIIYVMLRKCKAMLKSIAFFISLKFLSSDSQKERRKNIEEICIISRDSSRDGEKRGITS